MDFEGKTILVTGAGSGIGRAIAIQLAQHRARVVLLGRTVEKLEAVFDDIEKAGGLAPSILPVDLEGATSEDYQVIASAIANQFGGLYALVHVAGELGERVPFDHYHESTWQRVMRINFESTVSLTRALLPLLSQEPQAHLIFTSSSVGEHPRAYWGAYAVSKYALEGFAKLLAEEIAQTTSIDLTVVNPGATQTAMRRQAYPAENPRDLTTPDAVAMRYLALLDPGSQRQGARRMHSDGSLIALNPTSQPS